MSSPDLHDNKINSCIGMCLPLLDTASPNTAINKYKLAVCRLHTTRGVLAGVFSTCGSLLVPDQGEQQKEPCDQKMRRRPLDPAWVQHNSEPAISWPVKHPSNHGQEQVGIG